MKVLNKMFSGVDYVCGKTTISIPARTEIDTLSILLDNKVFKEHLAGGFVAILDKPQYEKIEVKQDISIKTEEKISESEMEAKDFKTEEEYRLYLIAECKAKGLKVSPKTGIKKLQEKLGGV